MIDRSGRPMAITATRRWPRAITCSAASRAPPASSMPTDRASTSIAPSSTTNGSCRARTIARQRVVERVTVRHDTIDRGRRQHIDAVLGRPGARHEHEGQTLGLAHVGHAIEQHEVGGVGQGIAQRRLHESDRLRRFDGGASARLGRVPDIRAQPPSAECDRGVRRSVDPDGCTRWRRWRGKRRPAQRSCPSSPASTPCRKRRAVRLDRSVSIQISSSVSIQRKDVPR